jgi:hypothetical protein
MDQFFNLFIFLFKMIWKGKLNKSASSIESIFYQSYHSSNKCRVKTGGGGAADQGVHYKRYNDQLGSDLNVSNLIYYT